MMFSVLMILTLFAPTAWCQKPTFPPQFEGRFTELVERKVEGQWVARTEVGTEYVDRDRNTSRFEVVAYERVDNKDIALPEERITNPKTTYKLYQDSDNKFACVYSSAGNQPDPSKLTWTFQETIFVEPDMRNSQETIWGCRTGDLYNATATTTNGVKLSLTYVEDSFTKRPVVFGISGPDERRFRVYRSVVEVAPNAAEFAIPTYFGCKPSDKPLE